MRENGIFGMVSAILIYKGFPKNNKPDFCETFEVLKTSKVFLQVFIFLEVPKC
ncbi:hypothetical protein BGP_4750 [Beggiatoa sp. PS]|nr:hypothetical protein BGP_4750 [Beggiatoa sp. PS]